MSSSLFDEIRDEARQHFPLFLLDTAVSKTVITNALESFSSITYLPLVKEYNIIKDIEFPDDASAINLSLIHISEPTRPY